MLYLSFPSLMHAKLIVPLFFLLQSTQLDRGVGESVGTVVGFLVGFVAINTPINTTYIPLQSNQVPTELHIHIPLKQTKPRKQKKTKRWQCIVRKIKPKKKTKQRRHKTKRKTYKKQFTRNEF